MLDEVDATQLREPDADWVVLATGGARGITAEVLMGLAEKQVRLVLVGRAPEPPQENPQTAALNTEAELRRYLLEKARTEGRAPKPVETPIKSRSTCCLKSSPSWTMATPRKR